MFCTNIPRFSRALFPRSTKLSVALSRNFKLYKTLEADNRILLKRLMRRVKVLFNLEGEAHGFIRSPVFPDCSQMRFLLTQARFLKSFVSNLGCGIKYIIEERKLGRHFRNLTSEYFNILEPDTWNSIGRKKNFSRVKINVSGLNEFIPLKLKIDEPLFNKFLKTRAYRLSSSLIRAKKLTSVELSYSDMDGIFKWAFNLIEKIIPSLSPKTSIEYNLLSASERHAMAGIGVHGNLIKFELPLKKIPLFTEVMIEDNKKLYRLTFNEEELIQTAFKIDFQKVSSARLLLDQVQDIQNDFYIPQAINNIFIKVRADPAKVLILPENTGEISTEELIPLIKVRESPPLKNFLKLSTLPFLQELEMEFDCHSNPANLNFLEVLKDIRKLDYLSVMIKFIKEGRAINLSDFCMSIKQLLGNGLKGLEMKFDISLEEFDENFEGLKEIKMLRILGDITPAHQIPFLLRNVTAEKLWIEGITLATATTKQILEDISRLLRGNDIKLKFLASKNETGVPKKEMMDGLIEMIEKVKGVKQLSIILEARIVFLKDDVKRIYDALTNSRGCLEKLIFRVSRSSFVEFVSVSGVYKISSHGFKPPMVKMWIIEPNGNWTEVFTQKDNSTQDFEKLGIPLL